MPSPLFRPELLSPAGNLRFTLEGLENKAGETFNVAPDNGHIVYLPLPAEVELPFVLLMRDP